MSRRQTKVTKLELFFHRPALGVLLPLPSAYSSTPTDRPAGHLPRRLARYLRAAALQDARPVRPLPEDVRTCRHEVRLDDARVGADGEPPSLRDRAGERRALRGTARAARRIFPSNPCDLRRDGAGSPVSAWFLRPTAAHRRRGRGGLPLRRPQHDSSYRRGARAGGLVGLCSDDRSRSPPAVSPARRAPQAHLSDAGESPHRLPPVRGGRNRPFWPWPFAKRRLRRRDSIGGG